VLPVVSPTATTTNVLSNYGGNFIHKYQTIISVD
jgi:hypothetical protein